jgi:glycosyltransferase involved in cell wall biosynthesis
MNNPLVSIIIPVFNGSNYIKEALESAFAQTYENCEIIVVNDGSTDNTDEICLSYGEKIRYYRKENGGTATALNFGIEKMCGEYFSWLSHDDVYYPRKVESQIEALKKDGDMTKIVISDYDLYYEETRKKESVILKNEYPEKKFTVGVFAAVRYLAMGCALLIHRSNFDRVGLFDTSLRFVNDGDMWLRLFKGQNLIYVNEPSFVMRMHKFQDSNTHRIDLDKEQCLLFKKFICLVTEQERIEISGDKYSYINEQFEKFNLYKNKEFLKVFFENCGKNECKKSECAQEAIRNEMYKEIKETTVTFFGGRILPVAIFGTGFWHLPTYSLLKIAGISPCCFIDNNPEKHNKEIVQNIFCKSVNDILEQKDNLFVLVSPDKDEEITEQLREHGFPFIFSRVQLTEQLKKQRLPFFNDFPIMIKFLIGMADL